MDNGARRNVEFVIVGAGVAGLTLAHQLVKTGHSVLLIERSDRPSLPIWMRQ